MLHLTSKGFAMAWNSLSSSREDAMYTALTSEPADSAAGVCGPGVGEATAAARLGGRPVDWFKPELLEVFGTPLLALAKRGLKAV
jgi:hypothetical protein